MNMLTLYDTIFSKINKTTPILLKTFYYKDNAIKYYYKIKNINRNLGYKKRITCYPSIFLSLLKIAKFESENYLISYEKNLFFNKNRNRYKLTFSKRDFFFLLIHLTGIIIIYYVGRSPLCDI